MKRWLLILEILLGVGALFGASYWASDRVLDYLMGDVYLRAATAEARSSAAEVARQLDIEREAVLAVARSLAEQDALRSAKAEVPEVQQALARIKEQLGDARAVLVDGKVPLDDEDFSLGKLSCAKTAAGGAECVQLAKHRDKGMLIVAEPLPKGQGALLVLQPLAPRLAIWSQGLSPDAIAGLIYEGAVFASSRPLAGFEPKKDAIQRVGRDDHVPFRLKIGPDREALGLAPLGKAGGVALKGLRIIFLSLGAATALMMFFFVLTQPQPRAMSQPVEPPLAPSTADLDLPPPTASQPSFSQPPDPALSVPPPAASLPPSGSRPAIALASAPDVPVQPQQPTDPIPLTPSMAPPEQSTDSLLSAMGVTGSLAPATESLPPPSSLSAGLDGLDAPPPSTSRPSPNAMLASAPAPSIPPPERGPSEVRSAFDAIAEAAFASAPPPVQAGPASVPGDLPIPKGGLSPELAQASVNQRHTDLPQPKGGVPQPVSARPQSARPPGGSVSQAIALPGQQPPPAAEEQPFDEAHYQKVHEAFVGAKRRLGESVDRITLSGFSAKLRKSEQQLIQKHGCKAVRFQVIEKNGSVSLRPQLVR